MTATKISATRGVLKKNLMRIDASKMSNAQWQAARRDYIGGSDVATFMDLNPYQSKLELFHQKVGVVSSITADTESTYSGKKLEDVVKNEYWVYYDDAFPTTDGIIANEKKGRKGRKRHYMNIKSIIYDPRMPFLRANVDGMIIGKHNSRTPLGILEAKTGLGWVWSQYTSEIPEFYITQIQTYMLITGLTYAEIPVLLDGRYFKCFPFKANAELHKEIIEQAGEFWDLVKEGRVIWESDLPEHERLQKLAMIEPPVDGGKAIDNYLKERFKSDYKVGQMLIYQEVIDHAKKYLDESEAVKRAQLPKNTVAQLLKKQFLDNNVDEFISDEGKVIISNRKDAKGKTTLNVNKERLLEIAD